MIIYSRKFYFTYLKVTRKQSLRRALTFVGIPGKTNGKRSKYVSYCKSFKQRKLFLLIRNVKPFLVKIIQVVV